MSLLAVPPAEVGAANFDEVLSVDEAENIESVLSVSDDVCANGDVAVNVEPFIRTNILVSDDKTGDAVPSRPTSGVKPLKSK